MAMNRPPYNNIFYRHAATFGAMLLVAPVSAQALPHAAIHAPGQFSPPVHLPVAQRTSTYYVSPSGSDTQPGTLERPFASLEHAHNRAKPGDTIYLRGGIYRLAEVVTLTNDGTEGQPITVAAYPGEMPVLDGSNMTATGYWDGWVLDMASVSWNHIKGLELTGGPEGGLVIRDDSHNNIIENLDVHHNGRLSQWEGKGIVLYGASSNNLLLNNDSHHNQDLNKGNADGFQVSTTGTGNVLRGNRAWANSDDGFDFFNIRDGSASAPLLVEGNWAFGNGYDAEGHTAGDGNGFKLGGARKDTNTVSGGHLVVNNLAWGNRTNGFDFNGWNGTYRPSRLYNNTAYNNGDYNFAFWERPDVLRNNLSYGTGRIAASTSDQNNSWSLPVPVGIRDFQSLDDSVARGPRLQDGSLPKSGFLKLAPDSRLTGRGVSAGLPDIGATPDGERREWKIPTSDTFPAALHPVLRPE